MAGEVGTAQVGVEVDPSGVRDGLRKIEQETKTRMASVSSDLKSGFEKAFRPALIGLGAVAAGAGIAVKAASDLAEQVNKTTVVFGKSSAGMIDWSKTTAKSLGISQRASLEAAGTFGNMLVPMGVAREKAAVMSKSMVTLASDMASFNNASPEDTLNALRAGLAGETEPLRRFGVFLNEARIQQEALNLGLLKGQTALKAAEDAVKTATVDVTEATRARARAASEVESATKRLTTAERAVEQSAKTVAAAQERVRDSNERLADAEDRSVVATTRVKAAKEALADAQRKARQVQDDLIDARKRATDQLDDLRDSTEDAGLSEERAGIALERARNRLATTTEDTEATELDRRDAMLAVREAEEGLEDAQGRRIDVTAELADAEAKGIEGSPEVVKAREAIRVADEEAATAAKKVTTETRALADANDAVADAQRGATTSLVALREAQRDSRAATVAFADAQRDLKAAQRESAQAAAALESAQKRLTVAKQRAAEAGKGVTKGLTAEQKAMATYSIIMQDTGDQQGDYARTADSLANKQRRVAAETEDAAAAMGKDLLPASEQLASSFSDLIGLAASNTRATQILVAAFAALAAIVVVVNAAMKTWAAVSAIVKTATKLWRNEQLRLNLAFLANPIGLIVLGIAALVAAFVLAYKHSETFRKIVDGSLRAVADAFKWLLEAAQSVFDWLKDHWPEIAVILAGPFAPLVLLATDAFGIRSALMDAITGLIGWITNKASALGKAGLALGTKLKDGVVDGLKGIATAAWGVIDNIGTTIANAHAAIIGWGKQIGVAIKDGVVSGITGIALAAWGYIDNIGTQIANNVAAILGWGKTAGVAIKDGVVDGITGVALSLWGVLNNIPGFIRDNIETIVGWGKTIGTAIKNGIVNGLTGLGKAIKKKLGGALGAVGGLLPGRRSAPPAAGPQALAPVGPTALAEGGGAGGLAGPVPPLAGLRAALRSFQPPEPTPPNVAVRVFIGDRELTDIVRVQVRAEDAQTARVLLGGVA